MRLINLLDGVGERGRRDGFRQMQVGSGLSTALVVTRKGVRGLHEHGCAGPTMGPLYGPIARVAAPAPRADMIMSL
jgi:hypothetical protein